MIDTLRKWGFDLPDEFNDSYLPTASQKKLDEWVKDYKPGEHIIFTGLNQKKYTDVLYLVWRLATSGNIKNFAGLVNLGDLVNAPYEERRESEVTILSALNNSKLIVFEDFDLYPNNEEYKLKSHWAIRKCIKSGASMVLLLTGDDHCLSSLLGTSTYMQFIRRAVKV